VLAAVEDTAVRAWLVTLGLVPTGSRRMAGGAVAVTEELIVVDESGRERPVVLQRVPRSTNFPDHDPIAEVTAEVEAMRRRARDPLTPDVIDADADGARCGVPAVLVSRLPGTPVLAPDDVDRWLDGLVDAIATVRRVGMRVDGLPLYRPWFEPDDPPPVWSADPGAWTRRRDQLVRDLPPGGAPGMVHRDLHPGNVLFDRGRLSGIVDWPHAAVGPIEIDVSRCRVEAAMMAGIEAADGLLSRCGAVGVDAGAYDRSWDAVVALELGRVIDRVAEGFIAAGARRSVDDMRSTLDELVLAADRWAA
jgi:aminoglycoside phosphotransferase (APT) family kinase protein